MSLKHEQARAAHRRGDYAEAKRLARDAYHETSNPHSGLNMKVAEYALGEISKEELDRTVYDLGLEKSGHGQSVLKKGF